MKRTKFPEQNLDPETVKNVLDFLVEQKAITVGMRARADLVLLRNTQSIDAYNNASKKEKIKSFQLDPLITPSKFDTFYNLYPRKIDRGLAKARWDKICNKPDRPTWRVIEQAIHNQKKSERWIKQPEFIPYPATWLNNSRWLDSPEEMKPYESREESKKDKFIYYNDIRYALGSDGLYRNTAGEIY